MDNTLTRQIPHTRAGAIKVFIGMSDVWAVALIIIVGVVYRFSLTPLSVLDIYAALTALVSYGCFEWLVHQYLFHPEPIPVLRIRLHSILSRMHQRHHDNPHDYGIMFFGIPSIFGLTMFFYLSAFWIFGASFACTFSVFMMFFFARYEWIHFLMHTNVLPSTPYSRRLAENHLKHHANLSYSSRGVSMLFVDKLMRKI